jgi:hypothetical protein
MDLFPIFSFLTSFKNCESCLSSTQSLKKKNTNTNTKQEIENLWVRGKEQLHVELSE